MTDDPEAGSPPEAGALRAVAEVYAVACDRRDGAAYASAFTSEGRLQVFRPSTAHEPVTDLAGTAALERVPDALHRYDHTHHLLGNAVYMVDGDSATGEVWCIAHHLELAAQRDVVMFIRYLDDYVRAGRRWLISRRRVMIDWTESRATDN